MSWHHHREELNKRFLLMHRKCLTGQKKGFGFGRRLVQGNPRTLPVTVHHGPGRYRRATPQTTKLAGATGTAVTVI